MVYSGDVCFAQRVHMNANQTEYVFPLQTAARIPITVNNTYAQLQSGTLTATISQRSTQGNMQYAQTNTQSQSIRIPSGVTTFTLELGAASQPLESTVDLTLSYGVAKETLPTLTIRFVRDPSQHQKQQQQAPRSKHQKQQQPTRDMSAAEQKLRQNNQDTNALKQQLKRETQEKQQQTQDIKKRLDSALAPYDSYLKSLGFSQQSATTDPGEAGAFKRTYATADNISANITGTFTNESVDSTLSMNTVDPALDTLIAQDQRFQEAHRSLTQQGYHQIRQHTTVRHNRTTVKYTYGNESATITATVINQTVQEVRVTQKTQWGVWLLLGCVVLVCVLIVWLASRSKRNASNGMSFTHAHAHVCDEAEHLLRQAEYNFRQKQYKEAYGLCGRAVRLLLAYEYDLQGEQTNDSVIAELHARGISYMHAKRCLDRTALVRFAQYRPNKKDFTAILRYARKLCRTLNKKRQGSARLS